MTYTYTDNPALDYERYAGVQLSYSQDYHTATDADVAIALDLPQVYAEDPVRVEFVATSEYWSDSDEPTYTEAQITEVVVLLEDGEVDITSQITRQAIARAEQVIDDLMESGRLEGWERP